MANILGKKQNANGDNVFAMSHSDIVKVRDKGALTEELYLSDVVPLPAVQQAYIIHSSQKWATTDANSTGYFVFVPDVTKKYKVTANSLVNSRVVALTSNTVGNNNTVCKTFATDDYETSRFPITAGESKVITLPSATKWLWIAGLSGSSGDATPSKIEVVVDTIKNGLGGEVEGVKDSVRNIVKSLNGSETPVYSGNVQQSTLIPVDIAVGDEFHVKVTKASGSAYISMACASNGAIVEYIANRCNTSLDFVFIASKVADCITMYSNSVASAFEITRIPKGFEVDDKPIADSGNIVRSGGVYEMVKSAVGDAAMRAKTKTIETIPSQYIIDNNIWPATSSGVYVSQQNAQFAIIPLEEGYDKVTVFGNANRTEGSNVAFLTSNAVAINADIPFCEGTTAMNIPQNSSREYDIPSTATHLLVFISYTSYSTSIQTPRRIVFQGGINLSEYLVNNITNMNKKIEDIANNSDGGYEEYSVQDGTPVPFFLISTAGEWASGADHKTYIIEIPDGAISMKVTPIDRCIFVFLDSNTLPSDNGDDVDLFGDTTVYDIYETTEVDIPTGCKYVGFDFHHSAQGTVHDDAPIFLGFRVNKEAYLVRKSKLSLPYSSLALDNMHLIMCSQNLSKTTLYWPWIVRTHHAAALGKYYMYFSEDHVSNSPIYMSYSDDLVHWTHYGSVATQNDLLGTTGTHDIETPTVIWDDYNERYLLFCHSSDENLFGLGYNQTSFISESTDGINWTFVKPFVTIPKNRFCGNFHNGYIRIHKDGALWRAWGLIGGGPAGQCTDYYSVDGVNWIVNPNQMAQKHHTNLKPYSKGDTTQMNEIALLVGDNVMIDGHRYIIYLGGTSGSATASRVLRIYINEVLEDGRTLLSKAQALTSENLDIRSVNVFVDDDGEVYLLIMVRYDLAPGGTNRKFYGFIAKLKRK